MSSYILRKIDVDLWRQVKSRAAAEGVTIKALLERLLRDWLKTGAILLLLAAPASAQSLKIPTVIYAGGMAADIVTSHLGTAYSTRCVETTAGLQWGQQHPWKQTGVTVGIAVGGWLIMKWVGKTYPRVAQVGLVAMAAPHSWQGWKNYQVCFG